MRLILPKKSFFIFLIVLFLSIEGFSQCSITTSRNSTGLICGTSPLSTCEGILYIGDGSNAMTLTMTSNLNLTCLGPIRFIVRNGASVDFSSGNYDLQLAAGSSIEIENGGQLGAATNCSASDLIKIGSVNVASCNGGGGGVLTDFPGLVASGGYSSINATANPSSICNSGSTTLTATASPSSGATYRWYNAQTGGTLLHTGSAYSPSLTTTTTYYVDASYTSPTYTTVRRAVTVTVNPNSVGGSASASQSICSGSTPSNISLSGYTGTIQWQSSTDNSNFSNISGATSSILTSVQMGTLTATRYYRAVVTSGNCSSSNSNTVTVTVNVAPSVPGTGTPYSASCTGFTAQWAWAANAINYILDVATDSGFTSIVSGYNNLSVGDVLSYTITGLNPATTYYYRVRASGCSTSANSGTMSMTTSTVTVPGTAGAYSATCNGFTAQWGYASNATNYILDVATDSGFTIIVPAYNNLSVGNVLSYVITGLNPATTYYYRVRASGCSTSASSATMSYSTSPVPASVPVVVGTSNSNCSNGLQLDWNQVADATGYYLDIATDNSFSSYVSGYNSHNVGYQTNNFYAGGLSSGVTYYYRIRAYNACATTAYSNVVSFIIGSLGGTVTGSTTVCSGTNSTTLTLSGHTGNVVRWESSLDNFATTGTTIANTTTTLTAVNLTATTTFRAIVQNGSCSMVNSTIATITVISLPTPIAGTPTNPSCKVPTGSVPLSGLPSTGTIIQTGTKDDTYTLTAGDGGVKIITGLLPGTYYFAVSNGSCVSNTVTVVIIAPETNTWSSSGWSDGTPTINQRLVFGTDYTNANDVDLLGCSCQVTGSTVVTIKSGRTLKIENGVEVQPNATLIFENNASLVQINDAAVNLGNINYKRHTAPVKRYDFTYWSSPVAGQTMKALSPGTLGDKYYSYNPTSGWKIEYNGGVLPMEPGKGYIIRAPQTFSITVPAIDTNPVFVGVPNNGLVSFSIAANQTHLLGNPYPSAIDADKFIAANSTSLEGTLYFWTHNTSPSKDIAGDAIYNYTTNDYITYNKTGGVNVATGKIAAGQGFFAPASAAGGTIVFNNAMRYTEGQPNYNNSNFLKINSASKTVTTTTTTEKNRVWLNLTNSEGAFKQTLLGYITGATNGYDAGYDGVSYDGNQFVDFYSVNNAVNLSIQGRALPFVKQDSVVLGYKSTIKGEFKISIDHTDGVLATQNIFLEDKDLKVLHDLKQGAYTFNTEKGVFNNRFVLRYVDKNAVEPVVETPVVETPVIDSSVTVSVKQDQITVSSSEDLISKIIIYDVAGKIIYQKEDVSTNDFMIQDLLSGQQVLLVTLVLENGKTTSTKIVY